MRISRGRLDGQCDERHPSYNVLPSSRQESDKPFIQTNFQTYSTYQNCFDALLFERDYHHNFVFRGSTNNFHLGAIVQGAGERKSLKWRSPGRALEDKVLKSWSSLQTLFTDFDCSNDNNLKILALFTSWFLTSMCHGGGYATLGA